MATTSKVKAGLNAAADLISGAQQARDRAKANMLAARNQLAGLPAQLADVIATIDAYTPAGDFESLAKDELAKLTAEFQALKTDIEGELDALGVSYP